MFSGLSRGWGLLVAGFVLWLVGLILIALGPVVDSGIGSGMVAVGGVIKPVGAVLMIIGAIVWLIQVLISIANQ